MAEDAELDQRRERAARNESLFREVNERIEDLAGNAPFCALHLRVHEPEL